MSLTVGFGRSCITPEESVPLAGYGNTSKRMSTRVRDDLYATCIAFTDARDHTVLLYSLDILHASPEWTEGIRQAVTASCGVPGDHIMVAHTHTHSAPDMYNREQPSMRRYLALLIKQAEAAAKQALADRRPAVLYAGVRQMQQNMNFIRNYITDEDAPGGLIHAGEPDRRMQLVRISREGSQDILLMNWQAHPCFTGGPKVTDISADYIGEVRKYMEEKTGNLFAFFQGAAGNVNARSRIPGERITNDCATYAHLLGEWTMLMLDKLAPVTDGPVCTLQKTVRVPNDHSDDHRVEEARIVREYWMEKYDYNVCTKFAKEHGLNSVYHATGILSRADRGESADMVLDVFSVGDLAFACAPYEMYSINGSFIKDTSPFAMTFIVSCCNTLHGYLAEDKAFDIGCYEVDFRRYPRGTAERTADHFAQMIKTLYKEAKM